MICDKKSVPFPNFEFLYIENIETKFISKIQYWLDKTKQIKLVICNFDINNYQSKIYTDLGIHFPDEIRKSVNKRQAEYLAGRFISAKALSISGILEGTIPTVYIGKDRSPTWPKYIVGSISHTCSKAVCAIGDKAKLKYIGVDIEKIIPKVTVSEIAKQIHNKAELDILLDASITPNIATTVIFSSKEALFKALYPQVKSYFGFDCARVSQIDLEGETLNLSIKKELYLKHNLNKTYKVYFQIENQEVRTLLVES